MIKTPVKMTFFSLAIAGVMIASSSTSWVGVWVGLELNMLSFLPLIILDKSEASTEGALKYFLVQASSSLVMLFSGLYLSKMSLSLYATLMVALLLKMGMAPAHFWFPMVSESLSWWKMAMLSTVQKIAPLILLFYTIVLIPLKWVMAVVLMGAAVGAFGGMNELLLRKLLSFSSINHTSWMMWGMLNHSKAWMIYFLLYCAILLSLVSLLSKSQIFHANQMISTSLNKWSLLSLSLGFMSLGGLPPLLGFLPKWVLLQSAMSQKMLAVGVWLILMSLLTLYYYTRIAISAYTMMSNLKHKLLLSQNVKLEIFSFMFNFLGLLAMSSVWMSSLHSLLF